MDYEKILKESGIRPTAVRLLIFKGIVEYAAPFSLEELYNHLETIDRSTVFRALTLFEEEHLLHSFEDGSGKRKYCYHHPSHSDHCGETARTCRHIHATCRVCGRSMCITSQEVPVVPLPVDFEVENINYIVTGVCGNCKKR